MDNEFQSGQGGTMTTRVGGTRWKQLLFYTCVTADVTSLTAHATSVVPILASDKEVAPYR
jgi:hypothetical protein